MYFDFIFLLQPVNLSETLENVLLSMCEESSQLRISLTKVLEVSDQEFPLCYMYLQWVK